MWYDFRVRPGLRIVRLACVAAASGALVACNRSLDLGDDVIWSSDFENGMTSWSEPPGVGGSFVADSGPSDAGFGLSNAYHHSGHYSAMFSSFAGTQPTSRYPTGGGSLFKQAAFPPEAYYSAWYYIPRNYQTLADWAILKFMVPPTAAPDGGGDDGGSGDDGGASDGGDAGATGFVALGSDPSRTSELLTLNLRSFPPTLNLVLLDLRPAYLGYPLPNPVPAVPIQEWFQIECFYRNVSDAGGGGEFDVWLNGTQIYHVVRPFGINPVVYFAPGSLVDDLSPTDAELYIDDVAVSWSRVTPRPSGIFGF